MRTIAALACGLLFGLGLTLSGMINPAKVLGFLDIYGDWDPSLAFVMAGAIPVAALAFAVSLRMRRPLCARGFAWPERSEIDARLIAGAIIFGVGWALVGFCPGPALASLGLGGWRAIVFILSMLAGMAAFKVTFGTSNVTPKSVATARVS